MRRGGGLRSLVLWVLWGTGAALRLSSPNPPPLASKPEAFFGPARRDGDKSGPDRRAFAGEFHNGFRQGQSPLETLKSERCQQFFPPEWDEALDDKNHITRDTWTQLLRPHREVRPPHRGGTWDHNVKEGKYKTSRAVERPTELRKRMFTYEDVTVPKDFTQKAQADFWCLDMAVRTLERPVKMISARSKSNTTIAIPAIWKVASTSIHDVLEHDKNTEEFSSPHRASFEWCEPPNTVQQACTKHSTFLDSNVNANIKVAFVRSPLDRFLSSVWEHAEWTACGNAVCPEQVQEGRKKARELASLFPHAYLINMTRSCEDPTQSYFLSATDAVGNVYEWDSIERVDTPEDFQAGMSFLAEHSGLELPAVSHKNSGGTSAVKRMYFDAVFSDPETTCSVCKVYAQDFVCLGYDLPSQCTEEACAEVGVQLPANLQAE